MRVRRLRWLHIQRGRKQPVWKIELFRPPVQSQGREAFQKRCDCEQQQWRQRTTTEASCHHNGFCIASSHSVKDRDDIIFIALSHYGAWIITQRSNNFDFHLGTAGMASSCRKQGTGARHSRLRYISFPNLRDSAVNSAQMTWVEDSRSFT